MAPSRPTMTAAPGKPPAASPCFTARSISTSRAASIPTSAGGRWRSVVVSPNARTEARSVRIMVPRRSSRAGVPERTLVKWYGQGCQRVRRAVQLIKRDTLFRNAPTRTMAEIRITNPDWVRDVVDFDCLYPDDDSRVRVAIALARENVVRATGGPFGAAVFEAGTGRLVGVGTNGVVRLNNSSAHAEVVALMMAQ